MDYEKTGKCFPTGYIEKFSSDSIHYYPLTQKLCLELGPYLEGQPVEINFSTDDIRFETTTKDICDQINIWSSVTACDFIVMDTTIIE
ncbi:MAG: hypothetical protein JWQ14_2203 [Adhaeribacter sp.]|nr:hypothetical protein [Adhaeribacter sp.]